MTFTKEELAVLIGAQNQVVWIQCDFSMYGTARQMWQRAITREKGYAVYCLGLEGCGEVDGWVEIRAIALRMRNGGISYELPPTPAETKAIFAYAKKLAQHLLKAGA